MNWVESPLTEGESESRMSDDDLDRNYELVLAKRAEKLASDDGAKVVRDVFSVIVLIKLGDETLGIPVDGIREVIRLPPITPLPWAPPWIMGLVQLRGELITVVNLSDWFKVKPRSPNNFLIVVACNNGLMGIFAESVLGFTDVLSEDIAEEFSDSATGRGRHIIATTKDLVSIIDLLGLLADRRLIVDQSDSTGIAG